MMERIEENDEVDYEGDDETKKNYEESLRTDAVHFGDDHFEEPLRPEIVRDSNTGNEGGDNRYTCVEGSNFDVDFDEETNNFGVVEEEKENPGQIKDEFDILFNGNPGVGKTSIIQRFVFNKFNPEEWATITEGKCSKLLKLDQNTVIKLNITDTVGSEIPGQIPKQIYRDLHGVVIVFDITDESSFNDVEQWIKVARDQSPRNVVFFIIGNKADLNAARKVFTADGNMMAQRNNVTYYEVSAKSGNNIALVFEDLANKIVVKQAENVGEDKVERKKERASLGLKDVRPPPEDDDNGKKCC